MVIVLKGYFRFKSNEKKSYEIEDSYLIEISIPNNFPFDLPKVKEIGTNIPRDGNYHINPDDTFYLGSPLRLLRKLYEKQNLTGFIEACLVSYLFAVSDKMQNGGDFF